MKIKYPTYTTEYAFEQKAAPAAGQPAMFFKIKTGCNAIEFSLTNTSLTVVQTAEVDGVVMQTNGTAVGYGNHPEVTITKEITVKVNAPTTGSGGVLNIRKQYMLPTAGIRNPKDIWQIVEQGARVVIEPEKGDSLEELKAFEARGVVVNWSPKN